MRYSNTSSMSPILFSLYRQHGHGCGNIPADAIKCKLHAFEIFPSVKAPAVELAPMPHSADSLKLPDKFPTRFILDPVNVRKIFEHVATVFICAQYIAMKCGTERLDRRGVVQPPQVRKHSFRKFFQLFKRSDGVSRVVM